MRTAELAPELIRSQMACILLGDLVAPLWKGQGSVEETVDYVTGFHL